MGDHSFLSVHTILVRQPSRDANVLRAAHAKTLSGALGKVEPGAHAVGNAPRSGVVDPDND